jgi:hypothetical protein
MNKPYKNQGQVVAELALMSLNLKEVKKKKKMNPNNHSNLLVSLNLNSFDHPHFNLEDLLHKWRLEGEATLLLLELQEF